MSRLRLCPLRDTTQKAIFQYKESMLAGILRRILIAPPLTAPYDGPYKVISRGGRIMKILMKGKVETVSVDQVKPAHFECEPDTGTEITRTTQPKTTHSKNADIARGTREEWKGSSSTFTLKTIRMGVKPPTSAKKQSSTPNSPAITLQSQATKAHLPRQLLAIYSTAFLNPRSFSR